MKKMDNVYSALMMWMALVIVIVILASCIALYIKCITNQHYSVIHQSLQNKPIKF